MTGRDLACAPAWMRCGLQGSSGCWRRVITAILLAGMLFGGWAGRGSDAVQAHGDGQTPFLINTDPANPGVRSQSGAVAVTRDSGLLGEYGGDGRFAGYAIDGWQDVIVNSTAGMARVQGAFVATSPGTGSSITVWYTGQVDFGARMATGNFGARMATGNFVAGEGRGDDAGYRAAGTISGTVVAPATLEGADIGLC